jgi:hypothetical protein
MNLNAHVWIENRSLRTCARPWLQSFRYSVSMSFFCLRWHQDALFTKGLSRPLFVIRRQGVQLFWKNRSPEFPLHLSLCSSAHTTTSLQWGRVAIYREHDFRCLVNIGIVREQSKMSSRCRGDIIYVYSNTGTRKEPWDNPAAIFIGIKNRLLPRLRKEEIGKEEIGLIRLV